MTHDWLTRDLPESFFSNAGHHIKEEIPALWAEIPDDYKQLAYAIVALSINGGWV